MALTANFKEISAPKISIIDGKENRTREFICPWDEIEDNLDELFPTNFQAGRELVRVSPTTYPGRDYLRLVSIDVVPVDDFCVSGLDDDGVAMCGNGWKDAAQGGKQGGAKLTLKYSTAVQDMFEVDFEQSAEFMRIPGQGATTWTETVNGNDKMSIDAVIHKVIPTMTLTVTVLRVPNPDFETIETLQGTVNENRFFLCDPEQLIYLGAKAKEVVTPEGVIAYDMSHKFVRKRIPFLAAGGQVAYAGWNHLYRPDVKDATTNNQWQKTSPRIYETADHSFAFRLGIENLREAIKNDAGL